MLNKNNVFMLLFIIMVAPLHAGIDQWLPWPFAPKPTKTELVMRWFKEQKNNFIKAIPQIVRKNPTKSACIVAGVVTCCAVVGKTLYNRYVVLPAIVKSLKPSVDDKHHKLYNWRLQELETGAKIRVCERYVRMKLVEDCSNLTIYSKETIDRAKRRGAPLQPKKSDIMWSDFLATIDLELEELTATADWVASYADGIIGGVRVDYKKVCNQLEITDESTITLTQEQELDLAMQERCTTISRAMRLSGFFHGNVNYDVAYGIYWQIYKRILRMRSLRNIVFNITQTGLADALVAHYKLIPLEPIF